jgi:hypothetical protein
VLLEDYMCFACYLNHFQGARAVRSACLGTSFAGKYTISSSRSQNGCSIGFKIRLRRCGVRAGQNHAIYSKQCTIG